MNVNDLNNINELKLSDFIEKVTDMFLYNIEHYPDEKPTLDGAFREILLETLGDYNER